MVWSTADLINETPSLRQTPVLMHVIVYLRVTTMLSHATRAEP